jgi:hypothetical protein
MSSGSLPALSVGSVGKPLGARAASQSASGETGGTEHNDRGDAFANIADHAKGITKAPTTGFDTSKIANRATQRLVLETPHPLLEGRVDWDGSRDVIEFT